MKRPKLAGVLLLLGVLLAYLMFMKRHYGASEPDAYRAPPPPQRGPAKLAVAPGRNSQFGIMFDAGSTGTRIHVFEFQMERNGTTVGNVSGQPSKRRADIWLLHIHLHGGDH